MVEKAGGKRQEQCIAAMLLLGLVIILVPLVAITRYNVPSVDDFAYATMAGYGHGESLGFWEIILLEIKQSYVQWQTWQGLYFSNFVSFLVNALCMREYYFLTTLFSLGFLVISELLAGCMLLKHGFGISRELALIFIIPCICLQVLLIPSPAEAFYWMCGAIIYSTMLAITFIYVALQAKLLCEAGLNKGKRRLLKSLILLGTIMAGGSNYICMMLVIGIGACIALYSVVKKHPNFRFFICNYLLFIGCVCLCVFSPGSARRQAGAGEHLPAMEAILRSFTESFHYIKTWTILPVRLLVLLMLPVAWKIVSVRKYKYPLPVLFTLGTYCIYAMLFTPNLYALGIIGAYRIQNIYRIALYIMLFVNMLYWTGYIRRVIEKVRGVQRQKVNPLLTMGYFVGSAGIVLLLILYYGGSTVTTLSAFRSLRNGTAQAYYTTFQERLIQLEDESVKDAVLKPYIDAPYVLFFGDIKEEATAWENVAMAEYYHKNSVVLEP